MSRPPRFIIDNADDTIQQSWARGQWYEQRELDIMIKHMPQDSVVIDVGANIGNHSMYLDLSGKARVIHAIEPIPRSYRLMLINMALNYCHRINVDHIGLALGDHEHMAYPIMYYGEDNLGSVRLGERPWGADPKYLLDPVMVVRGDSLFASTHIDLIKIDVEGMELKVLDGLSGTIRASRPMLFVEVQPENDDGFRRWATENGYRSEVSLDASNYDDNFSNHLMVPI